MVKLIISDFDGVLLDLKEIHFEALNRAIEPVGKEYVISPEEHVKVFDGLSTKRKLKLLSEIKGFPLEKFDQVNDLKQELTVELLDSFSKINYGIVDVISFLKEEGYLFYVASNAIRNTIELGLEKLGVLHLVDKIYSNQDVKHSKPNAEIYLQCMADAGVNPCDTVIIEDSKHGREAAVKSGAHVCGVDNSFDFTVSRIKSFISSIKPRPIKWAGRSDLNVLIPIGGASSRFMKAGYTVPKPLIDVNGIPMLQRVIENLNMDANYIFVPNKEHYEKYNLKAFLNLLAPGCQIIVEEERRGAAWGTLLAKELINNDKHLIIANSDQFVEWDSCEFMYDMLAHNCDAGILTFNDNSPKWSYAEVNDDGYVTRVAEKQVISEHATVGIYYWKRGVDYVRCAEKMIEKDIKVNGEFYVCPAFNEAVEDGGRIKIFPAKKMWGLGTPEDLEYYLANYKE